MDEATKKACIAVLNRLRKGKTLQDFRDSKKTLIGLGGYVARVEHPIDFKEVEEAVKSGRAATPEAFAALVRRMAGNCLRFCVDANLTYREKARLLLEAVDEEAGKELPGRVRPLHGDVFRCLKMLNQVLPPLIKAGKKVGLFWARLEQSLAANPALAAEYAQEVAFPMDLGRLTTELVEEGIAAPEFLAKAELVFRNCAQFWGPRGDADMVALASDFLAALEREAQATLPAAWAARALPPLPPAGPVPPGKAAILQSLGEAVPVAPVPAAPGPAGPAVVAPPPATLPKLAVTGPVKGSGGLGGGAAAPKTKLTLKPLSQPRGETVASSGAAGAGAGAGATDGAKPLARALTLPSSSPSNGSGGAGGATVSLKVVHTKTTPGAGGGGALQLKKSFSMDNNTPSSSSAAATTNTKIKLVGGPPSRGAGDAAAAKAPRGVLLPSPSTVATTPDLAGDDASRASLPPHSAAPVATLPSPTGSTAAAAISQRAPGPLVAAVKPLFNIVPQDSLPPAAPSSQGVNAAPTSLKLKRQPSVWVFEEQQQQQQQQQGKTETIGESEDAPSGGKQPQLRLKAPSSQPGGSAAVPPPLGEVEGGDGKNDGSILSGGRKGRKRERSSLSPKQQPKSGRGGKKKGKAGAGAGAEGTPPGRKSGGGGGGIMADAHGWERQCWQFADELLGHVKALGAPGHRKGAKAAALEPNRYDFERPVVVLYPYLAEEYLRKIARPMDFSTCRETLREHRYAGTRAFLEDVDRIFANAVAFNEGSPDPYNQELVLVARHVRKYLDLLALELLPLEEAYEDAPLNLSVQRRDEQRAAVAERAGKQLAIPQDSHRACYNEMRDLVRDCRKLDPKGYFNDPVSKADNPKYYDLVARPVCFKDVMRTMEAGSARVAQVVADLRLIVENALFYNQASCEVSEVASEICNAARRMGARLDQELPAVYLRIWRHVEREAELKEPLKKLALEGERQHNQLLQQQQQEAAAGEGAVGEKEDGEQKAAVAPVVAHLEAQAGGKGAGLRATGLPPRAPLVPPQGGAGAGGAGAGAGGAAAAAAAAGSTTKLKKEKKREVDQDRRQEERKRRERETKMKECILKVVRGRLERGQERLRQQEEGKKKEKEEEELAAARDAATVEEEQEGGLGGPVSIGRIDLSGVGRRRAEQEAGGARRLLSELLASSPEGEQGGDRRDGNNMEKLEAQLPMVPPPVLDPAPMDVATDDGGAGSSCSSSSSSDEEELDSDCVEGGGRGPLHMRLVVRVVSPPSWDPREEWEAGVPAYAFPQAPLVHLMLVADDDSSLWSVPSAPAEEEEEEQEPPPTPRGGHSRRRSRRLQSLADGGSLKPNGRPPVVVEVDGGQRWVVPALKADGDELEEMETDTRPRKRRQRQQAVGAPALGPGEKAMALLRLSGMAVQLVLPPVHLHGGDDSSLPLGTIWRQAKLWARGLLPTGGPASRFHERMARAYYSWLGPLALLPLLGDDGSLLVSPEPVSQDLKGQGKVRVLHLVAPVGTAEVWVAGRRLTHPAFRGRGPKHQGGQ